MLTAGQIIEFDRKKHFQFVKPLGNGGTGDTHLFKDETTDMLFALRSLSERFKRY